jgi:hypothetical protein
MDAEYALAASAVPGLPATGLYFQAVCTTCDAATESATPTNAPTSAATRRRRGIATTPPPSPPPPSFAPTTPRWNSKKLASAEHFAIQFIIGYLCIVTTHTFELNSSHTFCPSVDHFLIGKVACLTMGCFCYSCGIYSFGSGVTYPPPPLVNFGGVRGVCY